VVSLIHRQKEHKGLQSQFFFIILSALTQSCRANQVKNLLLGYVKAFHMSMDGNFSEATRNWHS
jgi:hypothetical protein